MTRFPGLVLFLGLAAPVRMGAAVAIQSSVASPQPAGAAVTWTLSSGAAPTSGDTYRWSVAQGNALPRVVRDYGPYQTFTYTSLEEGPYTVTLDVRDAAGNPLGTASSAFTALPLAGPGSPSGSPGGSRSGSPSATATSHPLVAIYSTHCRAGKVRVRFAPASGDISSGMATPFYECQGDRGVNIIVAGMRPLTGYSLREEADFGGQLQPGAVLPFQTGSVTSSLPVPAAMIQGSPQSPEPVALVSFTGAFGAQIQCPIAYDTAGNVIWYYLDPDLGLDTVFRMFAGGTFIGTTDIDGRVLREVDLMGNLVRETTAQRVSEQLTQLGYPAISQFNHDAIRLPNGYTAVIGAMEQMADQGQGPVDVLGDAIVVLDQNWQLVWAWNPFQELDIKRPAVLGEICTQMSGGACAPFSLAATANDWTHANSLDYSAADGALLLSLRNQDWIVKIDYRDGLGSGDVLWRLGPGGDFAAVSSDPYPWFTHQHDAVLRPNGALTVFDNGNTRHAANGNSGSSRGQVWRIDERAKTATLAVNDPLNGYSPALGLAQFTANGNLWFDSGFLSGGGEADGLELDASGATVFRMAFYNAAYRMARMADLYTPEH